MYYYKNIGKLVEHVRFKACKTNLSGKHKFKGYIPILVMSPIWEQAFVENIVGEGDNKQLILPPTRLHDFVTTISNEVNKQNANQEYPVLLVSPLLRPYVRSITERFKPSLVIMSQNEVHPKARIKTVGQI